MSNSPIPVTTGSPSFLDLRIDTGSVIDVWFPPDTQIEMHTHDHPIFAVILRGGFALRVGRKGHRCPSATVLIEPAGEPHGNAVYPSGAQVLVVQPDATRGDRWAPFEKTLSQVSVLRHGRIASLASRIAGELRCADSLTPLAVDALSLEMLVDAARLPEPRAMGDAPAWLTDVADRLRDEPMATPLIRDLAATAGVHAGELARAFRRHYHMSIGRYARDVRIRRAAERLTATASPIAQIAAEAGFADQSHFTREFKRSFGTTPAAYRRREPDA